MLKELINAIEEVLSDLRIRGVIPDTIGSNDVYAGKSNQHDNSLNPHNASSSDDNVDQSLAFKARSLSSLSEEDLENHLGPIRKALLNIDAVDLLNLKIVHYDNAKVKPGINIEPIHTKILPRRHKDVSTCVRYLSIAEVDTQYSIGVFLFPPFSKIPLHDHKGMSVMSRVLYGDLIVRSFDICNPQNDLPDDQNIHVSSGKKKEYVSDSWLPRILPSFMMRDEEKVKDKIPQNSLSVLKNGTKRLCAPDISLLLPQKGNLHEFKAGKYGAAILDVLIPPYDIENDRDCTFYSIETEKMYNYETIHTKCFAIPISQPEDFFCTSGNYGDMGDVIEGEEED